MIKKDTDEVAVTEDDAISIRYEETGGIAPGNAIFSTWLELQ